MNDELIPKVKVAAMLGVSTQTISAWVKKQMIPPPIRLSGRAYWKVSDLDKALEKLRAEA